MEKNDEALKQQQQQMMMYQQQMQKNYMINQITQTIRNLDTINVLKMLSGNCMQALTSMYNPYCMQMLQNQILEAIKSIDDEDVLVAAQNALVQAQNMTTSMRANAFMGGGMGMSMGMSGMGGMNGMGMMPGMGMNPQMGMGMGMPGMNPMMGMGGMGMGGMGMMPGMGMPGMMGMNAFFGNQPNQQTTATPDGVDKKTAALNYITQGIYSADPLIYLAAMINAGIEFDVSNNKNLDELVKNCISYGIMYAANSNTSTLYLLYNLIQRLAMSDYYQHQQNGQGGQPNMMGMNPMMGMGMGMPGMMGGMMPMMNGMDASGMGMNPQMGMGMGMPGMNPMMGMGGMGMMPGMMGGTMMPGMGC